MGHMLLAATSAASKSSSSGSLNILLIIVVLFGVLYFVMIRPQRNRQRKAQDQRNAVVPGSRVRTTAGMYATVVGVDGDDVILEVAPGVEVRYVKRAIMQVLPDEEPVAGPDYSDGDEGGADADAGTADTDAEDADHEAADADAEAAGHEAPDHDGGESPAQPGEDAPPPADDESPNGSPTATADERRAPGSV